MEKNLQIAKTQNDLLYTEANNEIWKEYLFGSAQPTSSDYINLYCPKITHKSLFLDKAQYEAVILSFDEIPSTMILSDRWPREFLSDQTIFCFIAEQQSAGVGQKSNKWLSPKGNLYMTVLFKCQPQQMSQLSIRMLNSLTMTINKFCQIKAQCKWVNDVFVCGKKVSGILVKNEILMGQIMKGVVQIGIGVNIKVAPSLQFTSLQNYSQKIIDEKEFTSELIMAIVKKIISNDRDSFQKQLKQYDSNLLYKGEKVQIMNFDLTVRLLQGIFQGVNESGHALINTKQGLKISSDGRMRPLKSQLSFKQVDIHAVMSEL